MANSPQARKRARQNTMHRLHNASQRAAMRTHIKNFLKTLQGDDKQAAETTFRSAVSSIDRAARKSNEHRNKAARLKRRLNNRLREYVTSS